MKEKTKRHITIWVFPLYVFLDNKLKLVQGAKLEPGNTKKTSDFYLNYKKRNTVSANLK